MKTFIDYYKFLEESRIGEAFEDGSASEALTFGLGTDGGYVLKNDKVLFWKIFSFNHIYNF